MENKSITPELYCSYKEKVEENLHLLKLIGEETDTKQTETLQKELIKPQIETHDLSEEAKPEEPEAVEKEQLAYIFEQEEPFNPHIIDLS